MIPILKVMAGTAYTVRTLAVIVATFWLLDCSLTQAQQWEYKYGDTVRLEDGKFRVIPVNGVCSNNCYPTPQYGYIAVGTTSPLLADDPMNSDVHIVRTDNNGARIWEMTYDITGNNDWDEGWSIIELSDGTGFMVTGQVRYSSDGTSDVFLMKIDCNGFWVWSKTYGGPLSDGGRDLIETMTGDPSVGTSPGDIVVAGYSFGPTATGVTMDGYLLRTTATGFPIWGQTYHFQPGPPPGQEELFYSLTETTPVAGAFTGDILAAGYTMMAGAAGTQDALVVRVNGDNGGVVAGGAAIYGVAGGDDEFTSVIELQNPAETVGGVPNAVLLGVYGGGTVYAVKLAGGSPATPLVQRSIFGANGEPMFGRSVREITFPVAAGSGGAVQWDLVTTGWITDLSGSTDMFLMSLTVGGLAPGGGGGGVLSVYGGRAGDEQGWSLYPVDATNGRTYGFILCGHTTQMWYFPPLMNPQQDMYLVKTDGFGRSGCERPLNVVHYEFDGFTDILLEMMDLPVYHDQETQQCVHRWELNICPRPPGVPCTLPKDDDPDGGVVLPGDLPNYANPSLFPPHGLLGNPTQEPVKGEADQTPNGKIVQDAGGMTTVYPNPVKVGDPMRITSPIKGEASLSVTNTAGQAIMSNPKIMVDSDGVVVVQTQGWGAGAYLVTVRSGQIQSTIRVVVIE